MSVRVAVVGASGRLGSVVTRIVAELDGFDLHASLGSSSSLDELAGADVVVDVSTPAVSHRIVDASLDRGLNVLVGTSGWGSDRLDRVAARLKREAGTGGSERGVIVVPNFSVGSVLGTALATVAARWFDSIEIVEAHHAGKEDSPSGTAVRTAELVGRARTGLGPVEAPHVDQLARGQQVAGIPIHSLRLAGVVASQRVVFGGVGETLTIQHDTVSSASYEKGIRLALLALPAATGLTVGLDALLGIDLIPAPATDRETPDDQSAGHATTATSSTEAGASAG